MTAALALFALACGEAVTPPPPPPPDDGPNYVLQTIEVAFNNPTQTWSIDYYKNALHSDFVFYFNAEDVGDIVNGYRIPASWNYTEDWNATKNLFTNAYNISLNIPDIGSPVPGATEYWAKNIPISLTVMVDALNGYRADQGWCDYYFLKQADGTWRLAKWYDRTTGGRDSDDWPGIAPSSLGKIKALFR